jgi:hypothetical protein
MAKEVYRGGYLSDIEHLRIEEVERVCEYALAKLKPLL